MERWLLWLKRRMGDERRRFLGWAEQVDWAEKIKAVLWDLRGRGHGAGHMAMVWAFMGTDGGFGGSHGSDAAWYCSGKVRPWVM
ncbi:hypothetical protein M0R45_001776 [Rubus argutus]|uniref:Uncharacterized protein n=1 Tax=Rubus argutus TaxID=59490 RepID=A0AAW1VKV0_RUBAR